MKKDAIAMLLLGFFWMFPTLAGAQDCQGFCGKRPIEILEIHPSTFPSSFRTQLISDDCESCSLEEGVDFTYSTMNFATAVGSPPGFFRGFDVIVFPEVGSLPAGVTDADLLEAPWQKVLKRSCRAIVTGLHLGSHTSKQSFRRVSQQMAQWVAEDGCKCSSCKNQPGYIALSDLRTGGGFIRYSWIPDAGVRASALPAACTGGMGWNDLSILEPHPIFDRLTDVGNGTCLANCDSLDDAAQSIHHSFLAGVPDGYESDGFRSVLQGFPTSTGCADHGPTCPAPWEGYEAALLKDAACCTPRGTATYIPFFREDPMGTNRPGTVIVLNNRNAAAADVELRIYDLAGTLLTSQPLTVAGQGNQQLPSLFDRTRLGTFFAVPGTGQLGNIQIETVGPTNPGDLLSEAVTGQAFILGNGDAINSPEGFILQAQVEASFELSADYFFNLTLGGSNLNVSTFLSIQNPHDTETAAVEIDWYDVSGFNYWMSAHMVPPNGNILVPTAYSTTYPTGVPCQSNNPMGANIVDGNAVVRSVDNGNGELLPVVGAVVTFDGGTCSEFDLPISADEEPKLGVDMRTERRRENLP